MDTENISDLQERAPKDAKAQILLLGDSDPEGERIIRDPYYVCFVYSTCFAITYIFQYIYIFLGQRFKGV